MPKRSPSRSVVFVALVAMTLFTAISPAGAQEAPKPAAAADAVAPGMWQTDVFPISFWCGPPEKFVTAERFKQIADAGFTHAMPPCSGSSVEANKRALDYAQSAGIKVFLQDGRMPHGFGPNGEGKERIDAIVADYASHPAFAGYFIGDEPGAGAFPALAQTVAYLRERDPKHIAYLNLYPNYCPPHGLGTPTYDEYVERFVKVVKPALVSYDHYHFHNKFDRPGFFSNLETVRRIAQQHNLPFWQIVLLINHFDYRSPTEAELRWEAMQTLAYGGKGVMYFTYWQPANDETWGGGQAIINFDGTPTPKYEQVKRVNQDVQAIGRHLLDATSVHAFEYGQGGDVTRTGGDQPIRFTGPAVTVGYFHKPGGARLALFANRDYRDTTKADVVVQTGGKPIQRLDKSTGEWVDVKTEKPRHGAAGEITLPLDLPAGDADLYRWTVDEKPAQPTAAAR